MTVADDVELVSALATASYEELVGTPEADWVEFKSAPYQLVRGIVFTWFPNDQKEDRGLLDVRIPAQVEQDKMFIVRKMVDETDKETVAVGIPIRDRQRRLDSC